MMRAIGFTLLICGVVFAAETQTAPAPEKPKPLATLLATFPRHAVSENPLQRDDVNDRQKKWLKEHAGQGYKETAEFMWARKSTTAKGTIELHTMTVIGKEADHLITYVLDNEENKAKWLKSKSGDKVTVEGFIAEIKNVNNEAVNRWLVTLQISSTVPKP